MGQFTDILVDDSSVSADGLDVVVFINGFEGRQRHVVLAILLDGKTAREVPEQLAMTEGAGRVTLHRALPSLAKSKRSEQP